MLYIVDFPVEALDEQALTVHIRKSERTYAFVHSPCSCPSFLPRNKAQETRYIIHEIEPAEANLLLCSTLRWHDGLIMAAILPYDTSLAVNRQEVLSFTEFKAAGFFFWVQRIHLVKTQKKEWQTYGLCRDHNETE